MENIYDNRIPLLERIERHFTSELNDDECWMTDYRLCRGYPYISQVNRDVRLSRVVWEAHNAEPIPQGMVVMHSCDNPGCINPQHLSVGTQSDNMKDCAAKGRSHLQRPRTKGRRGCD